MERVLRADRPHHQLLQVCERGAAPDVRPSAHHVRHEPEEAGRGGWRRQVRDQQWWRWQRKWPRNFRGGRHRHRDADSRHGGGRGDTAGGHVVADFGGAAQ
uniref:(northern house mosquito) hypothetical protein n=1 Tax=Culex pipiens TaxID=7175 RepID=A0A8D8L119_CULPI